MSSRKSERTNKAMSWQQLELREWDEQLGRRSVGMFRQSRQEAPFDQLEFTVAEGDDEFSAVKLPSGRVVLFVNVFGAPVAGTHLWVSGEGADVEDAFHEVYSCFGLAASDVVWRPDTD